MTSTVPHPRRRTCSDRADPDATITAFERGFPLQEAFHNGSWEPDPLVLDDQALLLNVKDKGLVVLTGCGHSGIVNTLRYARKLTGIERLYAVIGGCHLGGPIFEPLIPAVCAALAELAPEAPWCEHVPERCWEKL